MEIPVTLLGVHFQVLEHAPFFPVLGIEEVEHYHISELKAFGFFDGEFHAF